MADQISYRNISLLSVVQQTCNKNFNKLRAKMFLVQLFQTSFPE